MVEFAAALRFVVAAILLTVIPLLALLVARGPVDGAGDQGAGYWGEKTATVNWCEADYAVTAYVAEFANTLSSLFIILNGAYGVYMHYGHVEARYMVAFSFFLVVGAGSAAFHGTLWRSMQVMDEIPMVWGNSIFMYVLLTMEDKIDRARITEAFVLMAVTFAVSVAIINLDEAAGGQDLFLVSYGAGVVYLVVRSRALNFKYNKGTLLLLETSVLFYAGGFLLWLVDRNFCPSVRAMHLHALWHLGAGIGTYTAVLFWIWARNEYLQRKQRILGATPVDRWIEMDLLKVL